MEKEKMSDSFWSKFSNGCLIGITMLVPGLSGGTMAIVLGLYDKIIESAGSLFYKPWKSIQYLLPIGFGAILGFCFFSSAMIRLLDLWCIPTMYFFIGIIMGCIPRIYRESCIGKPGIVEIFFFITGIVLVVSFRFLPQGNYFIDTASPIVKLILFSFYGIFLAIALILPGISFSLLMMVLGIYQPFLYAIETVDLKFLVPLIASIGFFSILLSGLFSSLLKKYPQKSYAAILGFVAASVFQMYPGLPFGKDFIICLIVFPIGIAVAYLLQKIKRQ